MSKIKITCDSTCDLTPELYEKYDVEVIGLCVSLGDKLYRDGYDIKAEDVFAYVAESGSLPKTSAISVGEYEQVFRKYTEEGYQVVHINLSSGLSSCYQNACIAAKEVGGVYPVDSLNLSSGSGHLVIEAKKMAEQGMEAEAIAEKLCVMREKLDVSFVLQTLEYLRKGGRCSALTALGANLLQLRPEIEVKDGKMGVGNKYRGKMDKSITDYVKGRLEGRKDLVLDRIFVTHSGVPAEIVADVIALVKQLQPFAEVIETKAGCTISSHCGPNCLGVLFFKK
ncbi:MAG: DegV family protein [Ruminococcaceae bacterium]|nr:DegV family protein [Oscillospiraceae bacterium]